MNIEKRETENQVDPISIYITILWEMQGRKLLTQNKAKWMKACRSKRKWITHQTQWKDCKFIGKVIYIYQNYGPNLEEETIQKANQSTNKWTQKRKKKKKQEEGHKSYQERRVKKYAKSLRKAPQPISPVCLSSLA